MSIQISATPIDGLLIVVPEIYQDDRGFFLESYSKRTLEEHGLCLTFVQDNHSRSRQGVVRGLHYQDRSSPQYRLVRCTAGEIWDVVVDLRPESSTFGEWFGVTLKADEMRQLLIPPEFAHGFAVLSPEAEVQYKCTNFHDPSAEQTLRWDDPDVAVPWPIEHPILSEKDANQGKSFANYLDQPAFATRSGA